MGALLSLISAWFDSCIFDYSEHFYRLRKSHFPFLHVEYSKYLLNTFHCVSFRKMSMKHDERVVKSKKMIVILKAPDFYYKIDNNKLISQTLSKMKKKKD